MKRLIGTLVIALVFISSAFAQEVKPKFEKQNDLVKATYYYNNGAIKEVGFFKENKLHSQWVTYNEAGEKITVAEYDMGKKVGKWYVIADDTVKELTYESNKLVKVEDTKETELKFI